jgi:hypothetical protein
MTTLTATNDLAQESVDTPRRSRALAVRRGFFVAAPVIAGIFAVIGAYADPAAGISGHEMFKIYTATPELLQFKSLGFHWSYAFWIVPALLAAAYVRGRGPGWPTSPPSWASSG